jgi:very-short-patch-repair endonuclease
VSVGTNRLDKFRRTSARRLRLNATDAETRLWRHLRQLPIYGTHFRRQVPIGPYIVDFACMAIKLVIEVDGSQHGTGQNVASDDKRTLWLEGAGYRVIRFWNNEIAGNIDGVLEAIYVASYGSTNVEPPAIKHRRRRRRVSDMPAPSPHPGGFAADPPLPGDGNETAAREERKHGQ